VKRRNLPNDLALNIRIAPLFYFFIFFFHSFFFLFFLLSMVFLLFFIFLSSYFFFFSFLFFSFVLFSSSSLFLLFLIFFFFLSFLFFFLFYICFSLFSFLSNSALGGVLARTSYCQCRARRGTSPGGARGGWPRSGSCATDTDSWRAGSAALRAVGGRHAAARRAGGAVTLLPGGHDGAGQGAQGRGHVDDARRSLSEIDDYVRYLTRSTPRCFARVERGAVTLHLLGFSQGTATACRWRRGRGARRSLDPSGPANVPPDLDLAGAPNGSAGSAAVSSSGDRTSTSRRRCWRARRSACGATGFPTR